MRWRVVLHKGWSLVVKGWDHLWTKNLFDVWGSCEVAMNSHKWGLTSDCHSLPHHHTSNTKHSCLLLALLRFLGIFHFCSEIHVSSHLDVQKKKQPRNNWTHRETFVPYLTMPK
ncbi:hypothetical protein ElyMa_002872800 [Elysia marginata]|uniref:Uncharacterized protein n=1 Tax=Elysia marginata TaxID=1093978 RepID=A0AAV4HZX6_9GAST|nr:hypothetical protein ElyMa_002872800 [Elysia marginata]